MKFHKAIKTLFFFYIIILFFSCKKKISDPNSAFIGQWITTGDCIYSLTIDKISYGTWNFAGGISDECDIGNFEGTVRINKKKLSIKRHNFDIIIEPFPIDTNIIYRADTFQSNLTMTLRNPLLYTHSTNKYYKIEN